jgi:hypothetical protein
MERPIAYFADDGRSWRCDGCGSYGSVGAAPEGRRHAARNVASHVAECTPEQAALGSTLILPGDTVLVRMHGDAPLEHVRTVADRLRDRMPGVQVLVLAGAEGIDVYRPEER